MLTTFLSLGCVAHTVGAGLQAAHPSAEGSAAPKPEPTALPLTQLMKRLGAAGAPDGVVDRAFEEGGRGALAALLASWE